MRRQLRYIRFAWGWARARVRKWLLDPHRRRILLAAVALYVVVAAASGILAVTSPSATSGVPDPRQTLNLESSATSLLAANGLLYTGFASGKVTAYDAVQTRFAGRAETDESARYIVRHGDHIFVGGEERLTRLSPGLKHPLSRRLTLKGKPTNLRALASGVLGVWGLVDSGQVVEHIESDALTDSKDYALARPADEIAVSQNGVWALSRSTTHATLIVPAPRHWRMIHVALHCHPTAVYAEHDRAYVLCGEADRVVVLTDLGRRILTSYDIGAGGRAISVANGSLWILSPGEDHLTQYGLSSHQHVGAPFGVESEAGALVVDPHAAWIAEADDSVLRVDLHRLAEARVKSGYVYAKADVHGVPRAAFFSLMLVTSLLGTVVFVLIWQLKVNGRFPTFFPPRRLVVYALNVALYRALASGTLKERESENEASLEPQNLVAVLRTRRVRKRTVGDYSLDMHVRDNVWSWHWKGLLYTGANFVPGFRHRGIRRTAADAPTQDVLLIAWSDIANQGALCIITQGSWLVGQEGADLVFTLDSVFDRTAGNLRELDRPEGAHLTFRIPRRWLTEVGVTRCRPGTRIQLDMIGKALPWKPN